MTAQPVSNWTGRILFTNSSTVNNEFTIQIANFIGIVLGQVFVTSEGGEFNMNTPNLSRFLINIMPPMGYDYVVNIMNGKFLDTDNGIWSTQISPMIEGQYYAFYPFVLTGGTITMSFEDAV